jgi:type III secretion protein T
MNDIVSPALGLADLTLEIKHFLLLVAMYSIRFIAAMLLLPATAEQIIQGRIRIGFILLLCGFLAWGQPANAVDAMGAGMLALVALKETLIGLCLGYAAGVIFWIAEGVGSLIDNIAGYNSIQQSNPMTETQATPIGNLSMQLIIALFYALGGMLVFVQLLYDTYRWWPLEHMAPLPGRLLESFMLDQTDTMMAQIVKLASPCLLCLALVDLGIGLMTRTANKLEPNALSQPIKASLALLLVALSFSLFVSQLRGEIGMVSLSTRMERLLSGQTATKP